MRFLLTDNVLLNGGDAAILEGTIKLLGLNKNEYMVHCDYFDSAKYIFKDIQIGRSISESARRFPPRFFWRFPLRTRLYFCVKFAFLRRILLSKQENEAFKDYKDAEYIISCGGSFLTDTYNLHNILHGYDLAHFLRKKVIVLGQTIGPFRESRNRAAVAARLNKMDFIVVRDQRSYNELVEMEIEQERYIKAPDMAFVLEQRAARPEHLKTPISIGISVRKWVYPGAVKAEDNHRTYIKKMARLVDLLISELGARIIFISTCQGNDEYSFLDDQIADEVLELVDHRDAAAVVRQFHRPEKFLDSLQQLDVFIGTRMHSCILALLSSIPVINIEYEFKSRELFRSLDLEKYIFDIEEFEPEGVFKVCNEIVDDVVDVRRNVQENVKKLKTEFSETRDKLSKVGIRGIH